MKRIFNLVLITLAAFVLTFAAAKILWGREILCPVDNLPSVMTGTSRVVDGVLLYQYRCPRQHVFWVRGDQQI
jgi:hypothetical protein